MQNIQTIDMNNSLICKCPSVKGLGPDAQLRPLYPVSSARLHNHGNNDNTIHRGCDPYIRPRPRRPLQSLASPGLRDSGVFFSREGWILSGRVWNPYVPSQSSVWILYVDGLWLRVAGGWDRHAHVSSLGWALWSHMDSIRPGHVWMVYMDDF